MTCRIEHADGRSGELELRCRLDTQYELEYFQNGGILHFMLRQIAEAAA